MGLRATIFISIAILALAILWKLLDLPSDAEVEVMFKNAFSHYGFWLIIVGAYIEALLLIGIYFPGSLIIFLGVILAPGVSEATWVVFYTTLGLYAGYMTNYFLGKYGWYRVLSKFGLEQKLIKLKGKVQDNELRYLFFTFWSPSTAALTTTVLGITKVDIRRFLILTLVTVVLWNTFWGILVYSLGESALTIVGFKFLIAFIILGVAVKFFVPLLKKKSVE